MFSLSGLVEFLLVWKIRSESGFKTLVSSSAPASGASAATPSLAAAPLKLLEALALLPATLPILGLALHVLHFRGRTSAGSIIAAFARTVVVTRGRRSLLTTFRLLPVRLGLIYRIPAPIVVLLPSVTGVLVNIAIVSGVHIAAGGLTNCSVTPGRACAGGLSALRP